MKILKTLFTLALMLLSTNAALAMTPYQLAVAMLSTSNVTCLDLPTNLSRGSADDRGKVDSVIKLQTFLYPQYLTEPPTGYFGVLTEAAVVKFQKENKISPAEGFVGALTRAKIKELSCGGSLQNLSISSVSPSVAKVGEVVTVNGYGLNSNGTHILFDGYRLEIIGSASANQVKFIVPESLSYTINCITAPCPDAPVRLVLPGEYVVQVVNNLGTSNKLILTVKEGTVVPTEDAVKISSVSPSGAKVDEKVIIYGYNLTRPEAQITFDGVKISGDPVYFKRLGNFDSALEFTVPEYLSQPCIRLKPTDPCPLGMVRKVTPGTYELAVENKYGRDSVKFEVLGDVAAEKPYLSSMRPLDGVVGTKVFLKGKNLRTGSEQVYFGGGLIKSITPTTGSKGMISFEVPEFITPCGVGTDGLCRIASQPVKPGKYDVVVVNKNGTSNTLTFEVTASNTVAPKILSLTPSSGLVGTEVVIKGEKINVGDDKIYFKGSLVSQKNTNADVDNRLYFKVPSSFTPCGVGTDGLCRIASQPVTPGIYDIVVVNKNGTSNSRDFTVKGEVSTDLEITNFYAKDYTFANGSSIGMGRKLVWTSTGAEYCEASGAWSGTRPVNGEQAIGFMSQPLTYTLKCYNNKGLSVSKSVTDPSTGTPQTPVISSISPSSVIVGTQVTLTGERINTGSPMIIFGNGVIAPDSIKTNDSYLTFTVPASMPRYCSLLSEMACTDDMISVTPGSYTVKVVNSLGTSNGKSVSVSAPASANPSISSISPASGGIGGQVSLNGSNLNPASDFVWFAGLKLVPNREMKNLNTLVFTVPQTLFQCESVKGQECLTMYQPTPLGSYQVKVENSSGKLSNAVSYQVTGGLDY